MTREQVEHVLRAAGAITGKQEWVIVGSQAILGSIPNAPHEITLSEEVDLYSPEDAFASDLLDGSIGERSPFHETFGYYAHGVGAETATLPHDWRKRAAVIQTESTGGVAGICPHPADLAVSKLVAWREKDRDFVVALLRHTLVDPADVEASLSQLEPELASTLRARLRSAQALA